MTHPEPDDVGSRLRAEGPTPSVSPSFFETLAVTAASSTPTPPRRWPGRILTSKLTALLAGALVLGSGAAYAGGLMGGGGDGPEAAQAVPADRGEPPQRHQTPDRDRDRDRSAHDDPQKSDGPAQADAAVGPPAAPAGPAPEKTKPSIGGRDADAKQCRLWDGWRHGGDDSKRDWGDWWADRGRDWWRGLDHPFGDRHDGSWCGGQAWGDQDWGDQDWGDQDWGDQDWGDQDWGDQDWGDQDWGDNEGDEGPGDRSWHDDGDDNGW